AGAAARGRDGDGRLSAGGRTADGARSEGDAGRGVLRGQERRRVAGAAGRPPPRPPRGQDLYAGEPAGGGPEPWPPPAPRPPPERRGPPYRWEGRPRVPGAEKK